MREWLSKLALKMADAVGSTISFMVALLAVLIWLLMGPSMGFSERWMIAFNTGICVVTFLMVFLIQNAQNRNAKALHLKINELIRGVEGPRTEMVNIEQRTTQELQKLDQEFTEVAEQASKDVAKFADAARKIQDATKGMSERNIE
jgi:low affinity Fe/Cu permease